MENIDNKKKDNTNCCVPQCTSIGRKTPNLSFHKFPHMRSIIKKETADGRKEIVNRKEEWIRLLKIGKPVSNRMRVCSKHFELGAFTFSPEKCQRPRLKASALPTCFLPTDCKQKMRIREENSAKRLARYEEIIRFPKNEERKNAWVEAIGRKNWSPSTSSVICSKHFKEEDFDKTSTLKTHLKPDETPIPMPVPDMPMIQISHVESLAPHNSSDIKKAEDFLIENVNLKRKLEKVLAERDMYRKKAKQQEYVIKKQQKRIERLTSLLEIS